MADLASENHEFGKLRPAMPSVIAEAALYTRYYHEIVAEKLAGLAALTSGLHICVPEDLRAALLRSQPSNDLIRERPLLGEIQIDSSRADILLAIEKEFYKAADRLRLQAYSVAWVAYGAEIGSIDWAALASTFEQQHNGLIEIARKSLPLEPIRNPDEQIRNPAREHVARIFRGVDRWEAALPPDQTRLH
jgi:hypothetical protein